MRRWWFALAAIAVSLGTTAGLLMAEEGERRLPSRAELLEALRTAEATRGGKADPSFEIDYGLGLAPPVIRGTAGAPCGNGGLLVGHAEGKAICYHEASGEYARLHVLREESGVMLSQAEPIRDIDYLRRNRVQIVDPAAEAARAAEGQYLLPDWSSDLQPLGTCPGGSQRTSLSDVKASVCLPPGWSVLAPKKAADRGLFATLTNGKSTITILSPGRDLADTACTLRAQRLGPPGNEIKICRLIDPSDPEGRRYYDALLYPSGHEARHIVEGDTDETAIVRRILMTVGGRS